MQLQHLRAIDEIDASQWNGLASSANPFVQHQFLRALEVSRSAVAKTGWQPLHAVLRQGATVIGAAPLYAKSHSYGEYVFDHGWADAYRRAGGSYYPKLQIAIPFTPVPGPRLLGRASVRAVSPSALVQSAEQTEVSSLHATFCTEADAAALQAAHRRAALPSMRRALPRSMSPPPVAPR